MSQLQQQTNPLSRSSSPLMKLSTVTQWVPCLCQPLTLHNRATTTYQSLPPNRMTGDTRHIDNKSIVHRPTECTQHTRVSQGTEKKNRIEERLAYNISVLAMDDG